MKSKIEILKDPIINLENIREKLKVTENIPKDIINFIQDKNFYVSVGRLTRQKNFLFLIECINKSLSLNANNKFLIIGRGEQKKNIEQKILHYKLDHQVKILDYTNNIYFFLERAKGFILTSLWEDPGFVLIEAAYKNCSIITPKDRNTYLNRQCGLAFGQLPKDKVYFLRITAFLQESFLDVLQGLSLC